MVNIVQTILFHSDFMEIREVIDKQMHGHGSLVLRCGTELLVFVWPLSLVIANIRPLFPHKKRQRSFRERYVCRWFRFSSCIHLWVGEYWRRYCRIAHQTWPPRVSVTGAGGTILCDYCTIPGLIILQQMSLLLVLCCYSGVGKLPQSWGLQSSRSIKQMELSTPWEANIAGLIKKVSVLCGTRSISTVFITVRH